MRVVFVHGACVRDGAWWWHRTADVLDRDGIPSVSPALPSCGEGGVVGVAGFEQDVASVRAALLDSDEPTVVVGHSYGGIVGTEAAHGIAAVRSLVYVSSYLPEPGESLSTFGSEEPAPFLSADPDAGTFTVLPEMMIDTFMHDCPDDVASASLDRLAVQSASVITAPVRHPAWHAVPSTYVVCASDRGTPAERQRGFAQRANRVVELPTGHHPFLARPDAMAEVVVGSARA